jgi:hypothetical protein
MKRCFGDREREDREMGGQGDEERGRPGDKERLIHEFPLISANNS